MIYIFYRFFWGGGKVPKVCPGSNFFCDLTFDFFLSEVISFLKRKANCTIEQQKCKGQDKRDRLRT